MTVSKEKQEALKKRMEALGIHEEDLIEKFILGSGSGGQKVNKTSSCVYLKHLPTKIEVKCQQERSREMNRQQKKRRSRRLQKKILEEKRKRSETKSLRKKPEEG